MTTPSTDGQRRCFVLFLLALLPAGNALNPCLDVDTWWHLRTGEFIANQGRLPDRDPFSQLGRQEGASWAAYSWLFDLGLYQAYKAAGVAGILACRHALDVLTFAGIGWLLLRHARNQWVGLGTLALVTISLLPFMPERSWHFTIFFTTLTLHTVLRIREENSTSANGRCRFIWLPLVYVLWANVHIQFVMGLAVLALGAGVSLVEWTVLGDSTKRKPTIRLCFLGAACALATLATPYHVKLYAVICEYATQTQALRLVSELAPPDLLKWWNLPLDVLMVIALAAVVRRRFPLWDVVLLASAVFFSLRMQRDLWYGVLGAGIIIVRSLGSEDNRPPISVRQVFAMSLLALLVMRAAWELGLSAGKTVADCHAESYPVAASAYIRDHDMRGPLFNHFDWGGYLIWALPDLPVSIDGRTNLYGDERLRRSMNTWGGLEGWDHDPDLRQAGIIIAPKKHKDREFPLTGLLAADKRWNLVWEDQTAMIFVPASSLPAANGE